MEGGSDGTRREDLSKIIGELQSLEKDKLGKTAALHLERIREKNEAVSVGMEDGGDRRVLRMLQRGVAVLRAEVRDRLTLRVMVRDRVTDTDPDARKHLGM